MRRGPIPSSLFPLLLLAAATGTAAAQTASEPSGHLFDSVGLYAGQGVDLNLRELPGAVVQGELKRESSYFVGLGLGKVLGTLGGGVAALRGTLVENVRHGYEVVFVQHHGLQDTFELGAAYLLRSPDLALGHLRVNVAGGPGLSHAFGTPSYEDGPADDPSRRYPTQLLILVEAEWSWDSLPQMALVTRVHHRSGAYGTIAPSGVGSNFVATGLRYRF
jgi:hypothetical protein